MYTQSSNQNDKNFKIKDIVTQLRHLEILKRMQCFINSQRPPLATDPLL